MVRKILGSSENLYNQTNPTTKTSFKVSTCIYGNLCLIIFAKSPNLIYTLFLITIFLFIIDNI